MPINILMPALSPTMDRGQARQVAREGRRQVKSGHVICRDRDRQGHHGGRGGRRGQGRQDPGSRRHRGREGQCRHRGAAGGRREPKCERDAPAPAPSRQRLAAQAAAGAGGGHGRASAGPQPHGSPAGAAGRPRIFASPLAERIAAERARSRGPEGLGTERPHREGRRRAAPSPGRGRRADPEGRRRGPASPRGRGRSHCAPGDQRIPHTACARSSRGASESKQTVPHFYLRWTSRSMRCSPRASSTRSAEKGASSRSTTS